MIKYNLATMQSLSNRTSKKLPILPSVLFIDEGGIQKQNKVERCQTTIGVLSIAAETKFPTFYVQLEQAFCSTPQIEGFCGSDLKSCEQRMLSVLSRVEEARLIAAFQDMTSLTAKENLLVTLRFCLIDTTLPQIPKHQCIISSLACSKATVSACFSQAQELPPSTRVLWFMIPLVMSLPHS